MTRDQILGHRRRVGLLDVRVPFSRGSLERAAYVGLQDSMPRAAVLQVHARVEGTGPMVWEDPAFVQVWGPRYSTYVVAERDVALFTLSRLPEDEKGLARATDIAERFARFSKGRKVTEHEAGAALGVHPTAIRYGAPTGTIRIRWEGAMSPTIWSVPAPKVDPIEARVEMARRHLHIFGPADPVSFGAWAGLKTPRAAAAYDLLAPELIPVATPIGERWILASDEGSFRRGPDDPATVRLLPSGDAYWLLQGPDRGLLVPDPEDRDRLWTPRVWPGAVLVEGEIVGTWRRSDHRMTVELWRRVSKDQRVAIEAEAAGLPIPNLKREIQITWAD